MTWLMFVAVAQMLTALAWMGVVTIYVPSVWRILVRKPKRYDAAGCWILLMGLVQTAFVLRWWLLGTHAMREMANVSLAIWGQIYLANAVVAIGILHTSPINRETGPQNDSRTRNGIFVWFGMFILAALLCWRAGQGG
jgi:hypothetical protein